MVQKVEEIVEYIIKNLDGTDEDNDRRDDQKLYAGNQGEEVRESG